MQHLNVSSDFVLVTAKRPRGRPRKGEPKNLQTPEADIAPRRRRSTENNEMAIFDKLPVLTPVVKSAKVGKKPTKNKKKDTVSAAAHVKQKKSNSPAPPRRRQPSEVIDQSCYMF